MLHQEVKNYLLSLPLDELMTVVTSTYGYTYELEHIVTYPNDEYTFRELYAEPMDAVRAVCYGDYRYTDDYIVINQLGNIDSYNDATIMNLYELYIDEITWVVIENDLLTEDVLDDLEKTAFEKVREDLEKEVEMLEKIPEEDYDDTIE